MTLCTKKRASFASNLRKLILTLPTDITRIRVAHLAINTLLLLATLDSAYHRYFDSAREVTFSRVGAVYPDSAKIVVRYPDFAVNATQRIVHIVWREVRANTTHEDKWKDGPSLNLKASEDWVGTAKLTGELCLAVPPFHDFSVYRRSLAKHDLRMCVAPCALVWT